MKVYTKGGDKGRTSLLRGVRVSKTDDRIELLGTIDELNSFIGYAKVLCDMKKKMELSDIQRNLMKIMSRVADPTNTDYLLGSDQTAFLETEIDRIENSFPRIKDFILYGGCELSARFDIARSVARRCERRFRKVAITYACDEEALRYMNRLADYLYICAREADHISLSSKDEELREEVLKTILKKL